MNPILVRRVQRQPVRRSNLLARLGYPIKEQLPWVPVVCLLVAGAITVTVIGGVFHLLATLINVAFGS